MGNCLNFELSVDEEATDLMKAGTQNQYNNYDSEQQQQQQQQQQQELTNEDDEEANSNNSNGLQYDWDQKGFVGRVNVKDGGATRRSKQGGWWYYSQGKRSRWKRASKKLIAAVEVKK